MEQTPLQSPQPQPQGHGPPCARPSCRLHSSTPAPSCDRWNGLRTQLCPLGATGRGRTVTQFENPWSVAARGEGQREAAAELLPRLPDLGSDESPPVCILRGQEGRGEDFPLSSSHDAQLGPGACVCPRPVSALGSPCSCLGGGHSLAQRSRGPGGLTLPDPPTQNGPRAMDCLASEGASRGTVVREHKSSTHTDKVYKCKASMWCSQRTTGHPQDRTTGHYTHTAS